jgi:hypothetical protein
MKFVVLVSLLAFVTSQATTSLEVDVPDRIKSCPRLKEYTECGQETLGRVLLCLTTGGASITSQTMSPATTTCICDVYDSLFTTCVPLCPEIMNGDGDELFDKIKEQCPNINIPTPDEAASGSAAGGKDTSNGDGVTSTSDGYRVIASIFIGALAIFVL